MTHMVRPGFPGYTTYPNVGPRLIPRIEGLGQLGPPVFEPETVVEAPFASAAGSAIYTETLWHTLYSSLVGAAGGYLLARKPVAGAFLGAGAGALLHAVLPPNPIVGVQVATPNGSHWQGGRAVPTTQGRLAVGAAGLALLGLAYYFRKR